ncbi:MAG: sugar nucleotide-binding protein, partial [Oceanicoccus sp.]|uniref:sugar nucleotide-binding protein n=1 Tax=Oceanicoccus sp. TaxID=2691044 RepID=UPI0026352A4F
MKSVNDLMNVLVIGGDGMLGHQLLGQLSEMHTVKVSLSQQLSAYEKFGIFSESNAFPGVDIRSDSQVLEIFAAFKPDVLINAAGIVKQRSAALGDMVSIHINALLPHKLA